MFEDTIKRVLGRGEKAVKQQSSFNSRGWLKQLEGLDLCTGQEYEFMNLYLELFLGVNSGKTGHFTLPNNF